MANELGVPRELISYWETGARRPSEAHLKRLAGVYRTSPEYLRGATDDPGDSDPVASLGEVEAGSPLATALAAWMAFLERWADFLSVDLGRSLPGPSAPPRALAEVGTITDRRRASSLADRVREHYRWGRVALPDLASFLDREGMLVYRADLGPLGDVGASVPGAFYNHPRLGYSVVLNDAASPGRQAFTLAHGLAHALFHHAEEGIVCRVGPDDRVEQFANAFAGELLVPGKELRRRVASLPGAADDDPLDALDALQLATLFRVSYGIMLMRLVAEGMIPYETYRAWQQMGARASEALFGIVLEQRPPAPKLDGGLGRYPPAVLGVAKRAVERGHATVERAAEVLDVEPDEVHATLLAPDLRASEAELREHEQFGEVLAQQE